MPPKQTIEMKKVGKTDSGKGTASGSVANVGKAAAALQGGFSAAKTAMAGMGKSQGVTGGWIVIAGMILLIVGVTMNTLRLRESKCKQIGRQFDSTSITSFKPKYDKRTRTIEKNNKYKNPLHDYYIKSAYNCCAIGDFDNTYVDLCALDNVLKSGVRVLDFEIYSMNKNQPVVAVSNSDSFNLKKSFNYLNFIDVMNYINQNAFKSPTPNTKDPIFLHFRIKSNIKEVFNKMADNLTSVFTTDQLLERLYGKSFDGYNLAGMPLHLLSGLGQDEHGNTNKRPRVIIMVDQSNPTYKDTDLHELVNIETGGTFAQLLHDFDVKNYPNIDLLKDKNMTRLCLVIPDKVPEGGGMSSLHCCVPGSSNPNYKRNYKYGCQCVMMCFQNKDNYLKNYNKYFNDAGTAFVLKPDCLIYTPELISEPPPQKPENSFATRKIDGGYFSLDI